MKSIHLFILFTLLSTPLFGVGVGQELLYVVNGEIMEQGFDTSSPHVDKIEVVSGEEAVEKYGLRGSNGVVLVTLKFDKAAVFSTSESLREYISTRVKWADEFNRAHITFRYTVDPRGKMTLTEVLDSTSSKLTKRVKKIVDEMPLWLSPAQNIGKGVEFHGTERINVPYKK